MTPTEQQTKEESNKNPNSSLHDNIDFCQIYLKINLKGILIWNRWCKTQAIDMNQKTMLSLYFNNYVKKKMVTMLLRFFMIL